MVTIHFVFPSQSGIHPLLIWVDFLSVLGIFLLLLFNFLLEVPRFSFLMDRSILIPGPQALWDLLSLLIFFLGDSVFLYGPFWLVNPFGAHAFVWLVLLLRGPLLLVPFNGVACVLNSFFEGSLLFFLLSLGFWPYFIRLFKLFCENVAKGHGSSTFICEAYVLVPWIWAIPLIFGCQQNICRMRVAYQIPLVEEKSLWTQ